MSNIQTVPLRRLVLSPANVRKVAPTGIEGLAENIAAAGRVIQNLSVTQGEGETLEVVAGGRRLAALRLLAEQQRIPEDFPVPVAVVEAERAQEFSLSENAMREAMHPADQFEAFKQLADSGMGDDTIAARYGVTPAVVRQRLKLAVVSPKLIELFREGEASLEHMMALTLTDEHALQEKVWDEQPSWAKGREDGGHIRSALTAEMVDASRSKLAKYVGIAAYQKAGGQISHDLFDEADKGYLNDPALLTRLADEKLQKLAKKVAAEGWKWVRIEPEFGWQDEQKLRRVEPSLTDEAAARLNAIEARVEEIYAAKPEGAEELPAELEAEIERLDTEQRELRKSPTFTAEDMAGAGAIITIDHNGKAEVKRGYQTAEEAKAARKAAEPGREQDGGLGSEQRNPNSAGLSAPLVEDLTAHRTAALGARLATNPKVALIAVVHALVSDVLIPGASASCVKVRATQNYPETSAESVKGGVAAQQLAKAEATASKGMPEDNDKLWDWLAGQDQKKLLDLLAVCAAHTVDTIVAKHGGHVNEAHVAQLAAALKLDMADYWQPTAAGYLGRVSKPMILEAVKEACGTDGTVEVAHLKKGELATRSEKLLAGKRWLPELLKAG